MQQPIATDQPAHDPRAEQLARLSRVNTDDLLGGLGLGGVRRGRRLLERLVRLPARRFARQVIAYDDLVGDESLAAGGAWAIRRFAGGLSITGQERYPRSGPTLFVANHPGLWDTTALFTAIERPDLRIVAADRPFLRALPNTSRYLLYIDDTAASRTSAIRAAARHLRSGGAVLTFAAGQIEPDPAVLPGASESIEQWSASIDLFARFASDLTIVPVIVSGVLSRAALRHPLTYLRRRSKDRQWLAALLQIQLRAYQRATVSVAFGNPISVAAHRSETAISTVVKAEARRVLAQVPPR
ncbi:MAG TPA: 1-acyl-sn-glycerol-3-phosphate acyltransferase [Herpetosiphonaceae bacterium]